MRLQKGPNIKNMALTEEQKKEMITINRKINSLVLFSFLITFIVARLMVYMVLGHLAPNFFLTIKGVHIHHFTYGVLILVLVGWYWLMRRPIPGSRAFRYLALTYGVGLGLTFDEFGMWVRLEDDYWLRQSYDAIVIIVLILLNSYYYRWLIRELADLIKITGRGIKKISYGAKRRFTTIK